MAVLFPVKSSIRPWALGLGLLAAGLLVTGCLKKGDDDGDTTAPVLSMSATAAPIPVNGSVNVTVWANEAITPLTAASFSIANGSIVSVQAVNEVQYTVRLQAAALSGIMTLTLPAGGCTDLSKNALPAAVVQTVTVAPVLDVALTDRRQVGGDVVLELTFTGSEPLSGLTSNVLALVNASAGIMTAVDERHYRVDVTEITAHQIIQVAIGDGVMSADSAVPVMTFMPVVIEASPSWSTAVGFDGYGMWADLSVSGNGQTAVQRFRWIPAGTFTMGTPDTELGRDLQEGPQHQVTLTKPFWMADTECTQRFWLAVTGSNPSQFTVDGLELPVDTVSWNDLCLAGGFLEQVNTLVPGLAATLPTEAQWEYACRAGTTTPFAIPVVSAVTINFYTNSDNDPYLPQDPSAFRAKTVVVKSLGGVNAWGLYDMQGNVTEWCSTKSGREYSTEPITDPEGGQRAARDTRGGSWLLTPVQCRSGYRDAFNPNARHEMFGFRLLVPIKLSNVVPQSTAMNMTSVRNGLLLACQAGRR